MATGYDWHFTVSPSTITEITITNEYGDSQVLQKTTEFETQSYTETTLVTISAAGYLSKKVSVGTSSITLNPIRNLYAWTNSDCTVYTESATPSASDTFYNESGEAITSVTVNGDLFLSCFIYSVDQVNNTITIIGDRG